MDGSSKLITDLNCKLAELDLRVWRYRRDMTAEFNRYATDAVRDVPADVVETVSQSLAQDVHVYTSLRPQTDLATRPLLVVPSPPLTTSPEQDSPPTAHDHDREHDFQGLFTPSYLPLLDGTSRERYHRERAIPLRPKHNGSEDRVTNMRSEEGLAGVMADGSENNRPAQEDMDKTTSPSSVPRPPRPARRSTDEASMSSDHSGGPVRRSALRQTSSGSTPHSPRRVVRFDVEGEEVLPTASPPREIEGEKGLLDEPGLLDSDSPPRKKKQSSTKALQALSRMPIDENDGPWITMGSDADGRAVRLEPGQIDAELEAKDPAPDNSDDEDLPSDDDMAGMPPLTKMRGQRPTAFSPPPSVAADDEPPSPASPVRSTTKRFLSLDNPNYSPDADKDEEEQFEHDDQDLFRFDESGYDQRTQLEEHEESDSDPGLEMAVRRNSPTDLELSRSPAMTIPSRLATTPTATTTATGSQAPVGSYKGASFNMPIVSPELHAQAASMGDVFSSVGSLKDMDVVQSYRESLRDGSFTGAPRSFKERMMLEDLAEAEADRADREKEKLEKEKSEKEKVEAQKKRG